jgi:hypothetical protein
MTAAEKVLLPQSQANFTTVIVAEGADFTFKIDYSNSVYGMMMSLGLIIMAFASVTML